MFYNFKNKLKDIFLKIKGINQIHQNKVEEFLLLIYNLFIDVDVCLDATKYFVSSLRKEIIKNNVVSSLFFEREILYIFKKELINFLTFKQQNDFFLKNKKNKFVYLFVGLPGVGKTLTLAKLAYFLTKNNNNINIISGTFDIRCLSAIDRLKYLSIQAGIKFTELDYINVKNYKDIILFLFNEFKNSQAQGLFIDTPGIFYRNVKILKQISIIQHSFDNIKTFFVIDSMCGQDIKNVYKNFSQYIKIDNVIVTKLDSDVIGGIFLSIKYIINKPINFIGMGEKLKDLYIYKPCKIVKDFLNLEEIYTFIKSDNNFDKKFFQQNNFSTQSLDNNNVINLNDFLFFLKKFQDFTKFGYLNNLDFLKNRENFLNKKQILKIEIILNSMTKFERLNPNIIKGSRIFRITKGAGVKTEDVLFLIKIFKNLTKFLCYFKQNNNFLNINNIFNYFNL